MWSTARLLDSNDGLSSAPLPIVIDHDLRFRLDSKLMRNYQNKKGRQPTIITAIRGAASDRDWTEKRQSLEDQGANVLCVPSKNGMYVYSDDRWTVLNTHPSGKLDLKSVVSCLSSIGIRTLMVEGGASVISSFLEAGLVDRLIITSCPVFVGEGVNYNIEGDFVSADYLSMIISFMHIFFRWRN